uniref:Uncharacterized protein n=1 Tax=Glycine max TaxID=3847 RepID=C6T0T3_SOYBN|nr:unknown [Glycine max]
MLLSSVHSLIVILLLATAFLVIILIIHLRYRLLRFFFIPTSRTFRLFLVISSHVLLVLHFPFLRLCHIRCFFSIRHRLPFCSSSFAHSRHCFVVGMFLVEHLPEFLHENEESTWRPLWLVRIFRCLPLSGGFPSLGGGALLIHSKFGIGSLRFGLGLSSFHDG